MPLWVTSEKLVSEPVSAVRPVQKLDGSCFVVADASFHPEEAFVCVGVDTLFDSIRVERKRFSEVLNELVINVESLRIDEQALRNDRCGQQPSASVNDVCRPGGDSNLSLLLSRCERCQLVGLFPLHDEQPADHDRP